MEIMIELQNRTFKHNTIWLFGVKHSMQFKTWHQSKMVGKGVANMEKESSKIKANLTWKQNTTQEHKKLNTRKASKHHNKQSLKMYLKNISATK